MLSIAAHIEKLDINITHACNLKCDFCYDAKSESSRQDLNADHVPAILKLVSSSSKIRSITLMGGEVSLRWAFTYEKLIAPILGSAYQGKITVFSNGVRLTKEMLTDIRRHGDRIQVYNSFMPIKSIYDRHKGFSGQRSTYDLVAANIQKNLDNSGAENVKVMLTWNVDDIPYIYDLITGCYALGVREVNGFFIKGAELSEEDFDEFDTQMGEVSRYLMSNTDRRFNPLLSAYMNSPEQLEREYDAFRRGVASTLCGSGKTKYVIDTDGYIYPCVCMVHRPFRVAHLDGREFPLLKRLQGVSDPGCAGCKVSASCKLCMGHSHKLTGTIFTFKHPNVCRLAGIYDRHRRVMLRSAGYHVE